MRVIPLQCGFWGFRWMNGPLMSYDTKQQAEEALSLMLKAANARVDYLAGERTREPPFDPSQRET